MLIDKFIDYIRGSSLVTLLNTIEVREVISELALETIGLRKLSNFFSRKRIGIFSVLI